jgi:hypothetical protein
MSTDLRHIKFGGIPDGTEVLTAIIFTPTSSPGRWGWRAYGGIAISGTASGQHPHAGDPRIVLLKRVAGDWEFGVGYNSGVLDEVSVPAPGGRTRAELVLRGALWYAWVPFTGLGNTQTGGKERPVVVLGRGDGQGPYLCWPLFDTRSLQARDGPRRRSLRLAHWRESQLDKPTALVFQPAVLPLGSLRRPIGYLHPVDMQAMVDVIQDDTSDAD